MPLNVGQIGDEIDGPGKTFHDDVTVDNLLEALVELTAVVWTHRDRVIVLEQVLQQHIGEGKVDLTALIEMHQPSSEDLAFRRAEREALVENVFRSFGRSR